jgi:hypothetical protein
MAQRMESVAPPGGVMLSESTARLVEGAVLGEPELLRVKGAEEPPRPTVRVVFDRHRDRIISAVTGLGQQRRQLSESLDQYRARPSAAAGSSTDRSVPRVWASTVARTSGTGLAVRAANWPPCRGLVRCFGCKA